MTIKDLEKILLTIKNKKLKVYMSSYSTQEVNGYYFGNVDGEEVLMFTNLNVEPRITDRDEIQERR